MTGKAIQNQEEEEYEEEDFSSRRDGPSSSNPHNNNDTDSYKDGKNTDKACAMRSKHSVTEQRRRSKINERFQMLRDLIPHSDQKRDTASFLLEGIEYVQYLQEKVLKFEGPYQGSRSEPTKFMPWNFIGQPQALEIGSGPLSTFPGKFYENNVTITTPTALTSRRNPVESDPSRDISCGGMQQQSELSNKVLPFSARLKKRSPALGRDDDGAVIHPLRSPSSDAQSVDFRPIGEAVNNNQHEELTIESGTIRLSSVYSQGLLNNLTRALQSGGVDLSQANISVQIDLGKRANKLVSGIDATKDFHKHHCSNHAISPLKDASVGGDTDQSQKRLKA